MARDRFPSDDARRKSRPHVKVHLTVATHQKTAAVWADPESRGMLVELWRIAGEAFAGRTGDEVILTRAACAAIAGRTQHAHNLRAIRALCVRVGYAMSERGACVSIVIRNFARKQGFVSAGRGDTPRTPPPSDSDSDSDTEKRSARSAKRRRKTAKEPDLFTRAFVETIEPGFFSGLAGDRPDLPASVRTGEHARAWLLGRIAKMDSLGKYTDVRRTARNWFATVTAAELIEAHERQIKATIRSMPSDAEARASPAAPAVVAAVLSMTTRLERKPA